MTDRKNDCRIAQWLGLFNGYELSHLLEVYASVESYNCIKHYTTSDSDAILLLPVLVERGYYPTLEWKEEWQFQIWERVSIGVGITHYEYNFVCESVEPTIAAAITSAVLKLIEEEKP